MNENNKMTLKCCNTPKKINGPVDDNQLKKFKNILIAASQKNLKILLDNSEKESPALAIKQRMAAEEEQFKENIKSILLPIKDSKKQFKSRIDLSAKRI